MNDVTEEAMNYDLRWREIQQRILTHLLNLFTLRRRLSAFRRSLHSINYCNLLLADFYINENQKRTGEKSHYWFAVVSLVSSLLFLL
jgi:hypothetical protein